ncbi:SDR family oxidoreductase [Rhodobacteraceae bacterium NNCM2]|nr:SDR family oxidoreductase [Coraliihabitans acroporae]
MRLQGKKALITAAGQGIGKATAEAFHAEGAEVFATDINEDLLADLPEGVTRFRLNALDDGDLAMGIERAAPDILFNCAGFVHAGTLLESTDDDWDFAFGLNARAMWKSMQLTVPGMIERGGGSIINMASAVSSIIAAPNRCIYGASKAAVVGLTKSVAVDYITNGIRVNAICPGTVESPSLEQRLRDTGDYEAARKAFIARQPMGRMATAAEIASLAVYLASDESAFVTGQTHIIDGGWSVA